MQYIIVGDTEKHKGCLIYPVCGDRGQAEEVLNRVLTNPTANDLRLIDGMTNIRIDTAEDKECWWDDPVLCN